MNVAADGRRLERAGGAGDVVGHRDHAFARRGVGHACRAEPDGRVPRARAVGFVGRGAGDLLRTGSRGASTTGRRAMRCSTRRSMRRPVRCCSRPTWSRRRLRRRSGSAIRARGGWFGGVGRSRGARAICRRARRPERGQRARVQRPQRRRRCGGDRGGPRGRRLVRVPLQPGTAAGATARTCAPGAGRRGPANRAQATCRRSTSPTASTITWRRRRSASAPAQGAFEGADQLELNTYDGAVHAAPDGDHVNNANMFTPPDGQSPLMQMYLFRTIVRSATSTAATTRRCSTTSTPTASRTGSSSTRRRRAR